MKATHKPPADVDVTPADILRFAALYIERHGWCQGDYYTVVFDAVTPRACASGAIAMAAYGSAIDLPYVADLPEKGTYRAALAVLADYLGVQGVSGVFRWNDAPRRTATEVTAVLRAAADTWNPCGGAR